VQTSGRVAGKKKVSILESDSYGVGVQENICMKLFIYFSCQVIDRGNMETKLMLV
jgi:hypothetical protein